jgi:hypothetical protein
LCGVDAEEAVEALVHPNQVASRPIQFVTSLALPQTMNSARLKSRSGEVAGHVGFWISGSERRVTKQRVLSLFAVLALAVFLGSALVRPLLFEREFRRQMERQIESASADSKFPKQIAQTLLATAGPDYANEVIWCLFHPFTEVHTMHLFLDDPGDGRGVYAVASAERDGDGQWSLSVER